MPISVSMTPPDASPVPVPVSMTQPDASSVPVPVRVTPTMPSSSDEPHSGLLEPAPFNDIGTLLEPTRSIDDKCRAVSKDEKYSLLYKHIPPPTTFPSTFLHGNNRKFSNSWLERYPWFLYSPKLNAVFGGPCSLLLPSSQQKDKGLLVNRPFSIWVKLNKILNNHSMVNYHRHCLQDVDILKSTIDNPARRIDVMASSALQIRMNENKHILRQIVRAIIYLGRQGLPLRGDNEEVNHCKNPGNCLALLKNYAQTDEILFNHLNSPRAKNATYTSPRSENIILLQQMKYLVITLSICPFVCDLQTRNVKFVKNSLYL